MHELRRLPALTSNQVRQSVEAIVATQGADGCIPWNPASHADPWDHVEAAMALSVAGRRDAADAAFAWLARAQRLDGAWAASYRDGMIDDPTLDANFSSYVAAGVWHHWLCFGDMAWLERAWPMVERAIDFTLDLQTPSGEIQWARDAAYRAWPGALLTSSSCIHLSLACALEIAATLGDDRPDWELSLVQLGRALARPELFEPKERFSMDWYYPVLSGALDAGDAMARLADRWDEFVVEGWGVRCVADRPWVTTGETCELVLALASLGEIDEAERIFSWVHRLRAPDGNYWTGATFPDGTIWPHEQTTWNAGAVILAWDMLREGTTAALFEAPRRATGIELPAAAADPV
ncbi:MAG TPA: prenyltransferase [Actinomycetota bacterium]|jgi:hypothetical protein